MPTGNQDSASSKSKRESWNRDVPLQDKDLLVKTGP
jgi:hypothetical protein